MAGTGSYHTRINDHPLSLGVIRYSTGDKDTDDFIWKMVVSNFCGSKKLTSIEVTISDLVQIKSFCDKAIEIVRTDGGRVTAPDNTPHETAQGG